MDMKFLFGITVTLGTVGTAAQQCEYLMPLNHTLKNGLNGKFCYCFTTVKIVKVQMPHYDPVHTHVRQSFTIYYVLILCSALTLSILFHVC